jgi:hypothetical protein
MQWPLCATIINYHQQPVAARHADIRSLSLAIR